MTAGGPSAGREDVVIIDMPSTTANGVAKRMVELRVKHGAIALGRVLTLVLVVDERRGAGHRVGQPCES